MPTAIVIDGAYFLRRFRSRHPTLNPARPKDVAFGVVWLAASHAPRSGRPLTKRTQVPVSGRSLDLARTTTALSRLAIHDELPAVRKVAPRSGRLNEKSGWRPRPDAVRQRLVRRDGLAPVDEDFEIDTVQKGVDMRPGLDVAAMAFKRQVDQIVLVAAGADFVPAARLARRGGIDVVLDPMGATPATDLIANVDGVRQVASQVPPTEPS